MKVLQLSTDDGRGGAGVAARRLHLLLRNAGEDSQLLVKDLVAGTHAAQSLVTNLPTKLREGTREILDQLPLRLYPRRKHDYFSPGIYSANLTTQLREIKPDVVHLHWGLRGFVSAETLTKIPQPIVWTLHDMWALTGGCHYSADCLRYRIGCGKCPALGSRALWDLSRWNWRRKFKSYKRKPLHIISPSRWLAGLVRQSSLLGHATVDVLPNPIDTGIFRPWDRAFAKSCLRLPSDLPLVVCGAVSQNEPRKGFDLLVKALDHYTQRAGNLEIALILFGPTSNLRFPPPKKIRVIYLGVLEDEITLSMLFNSADALVLPSREENLSLTLTEALCCGARCVAFDVGGNGDLVLHQNNGYLAKPFDSEDLSNGLAWTLADAASASRDVIAREAQALVSPEVLIPRFIDIYQKCLRQNP